VNSFIKTYSGIGYEVGLELGKGLEYLRGKRDSPDIAILLTNSLLEREIKEFRRRVRPTCLLQAGGRFFLPGRSKEFHSFMDFMEWRSEISPACADRNSKGLTG